MNIGRKIFTLKDVNSTDWLVLIHSDGEISKDGSLQVDFTSVKNNLVYGRSYRARESYETGFNFDRYRNRILMTDKEFKSFGNKANIKLLLIKEVEDFGIDFTKISFRRKVLSKRAWEDVRGQKYLAQYKSSLLIEGSNFTKRGREQQLAFNEFKNKLSKILHDNKIYFTIDIDFVKSIKLHHDLVW